MWTGSIKPVPLKYGKLATKQNTDILYSVLPRHSYRVRLTRPVYRLQNFLTLSAPGHQTQRTYVTRQHSGILLTGTSDE